jgi:hypothetical protein
MKLSFKSFKEEFYGSETPGPARIICIYTLFVAFLFFFYGAWVDFIPSEEWQKFCVFVAAILSALVVVFMLYIVFTRQLIVAPKQNFLQLSVGMLILPFISYFIFWATLAQGFPALFTRIAGSDYAETATLNYERYTGRGGCRHRLKGPKLDRAFSNYLCAPPEMRTSQPHHVILSGKSSYFGFYIITLSSDL